MSFRTLLAASGLIASLLPVQAETNWQDALPAYYLVDAVARNCKNIAFGQDELAHIQQAIAFAESQSGIDPAERNEIARDMEESITGNSAVCKQMATSVHESIKAMLTK